MTITYIPDSQFHAEIDAQLDAEGLTGQEREDRDLYLTETKLGVEEVWPATWKTLHKNATPEDRVRQIVAERRGRK